MFNADTHRFELDAGDGTSGDFGFDKGTREDIWMSLTRARLFDKFGVGKSASKKEKKLSISTIDSMLNQAYDFMFWVDEHEIDFMSVSQPREELLVIATINDNKEIFKIPCTNSYLPVDEVLRRLEIGGNKIPVLLGPMLPLSADFETGEYVSFQILAGKVDQQQIESTIQLKNLARMQQIKPDRVPADFYHPIDPLEDVTIVDDREWSRTHSDQLANVRSRQRG